MTKNTFIIFLFVIFLAISGCSKDRYVPIAKRYSDERLYIEGDGQGIYNGMTYGLEDRENFKLSRKLLSNKDIEFKEENTEEIMNELIVISLYQYVYDSFPSEKEFNRYIKSHSNDSPKKVIYSNLGKEYVSSYTKAFKEGYAKSISCTDKEAQRYEELLIKARNEE